MNEEGVGKQRLLENHNEQNQIYTIIQKDKVRTVKVNGEKKEYERNYML